jgi:hypothetical protein
VQDSGQFLSNRRISSRSHYGTPTAEHVRWTDLDPEPNVRQLNDRSLAECDAQLVKIQVICVHKFETRQSISKEALLYVRWEEESHISGWVEDKCMLCWYDHKIDIRTRFRGNQVRGSCSTGELFGGIAARVVGHFAVADGREPSLKNVNRIVVSTTPSNELQEEPNHSIVALGTSATTSDDSAHRRTVVRWAGADNQLSCRRLWSFAPQPGVLGQCIGAYL